MSNRIKIVFASLFLALTLMSLISAAGIASPYWEDNPLEMNYGETQVVNFNLQNLVGGEDITVRVEITEGQTIASVENEVYTAKAGTSDTMIPVTISIPADYDKTIQRVKVEVKTINQAEDEGMVGLGTGWTTSFNVILSEEAQDESSLSTLLVVLLAVIIAIVVIILVVLKRKK